MGEKASEGYGLVTIGQLLHGLFDNRDIAQPQGQDDVSQKSPPVSRNVPQDESEHEVA